MLHEDAAAVRARAERLAAAVGGEVEETRARVGGGALPLAELRVVRVRGRRAARSAAARRRAAGDRDRPRRAPAARLPDARRRARRTRSPPPCAHAADDRDRRPHRPRQDVARTRADRQGHRPAARRSSARGISIDLGYAPLELPDGRRARSSTCPGHERFVRTMIAGATGIDLFLLVIDAQEGARPQTLEHLAVLRLLGVELGVVAVTKADAVDEETLELALDEARELVPGAPVVAVSAKTGAGLDDLRAALAALPVEERTRGRTDAVLRRPRVLAAWHRDRRDRNALVGQHRRRRHAARRAGRAQRAGALRAGARRAGRTRRCGPARRGQPRRRSSAATLPEATRSSPRGAIPVSYRLDIALTELEPIPAVGDRPPRDGGRAGTGRASGEFAQLRLERRVVAARGDRVVLRTDTTVGGGVVLDPAPPRRLEPARLELLRPRRPERDRCARSCTSRSHATRSNGAGC